MHILGKIRANTIGHPVFVSLAIAIFFGNVCGYLATRHHDADERIPCIVESTAIASR